MFFHKRAALKAICDYLHAQLLIKALYWQYDYFIPNGVQILIYDFTFVQRLPVQLKFHVGITCAFKGEQEQDRFFTNTRESLGSPLSKDSLHTGQARSVRLRTPRTNLSARRD